MTSHRTRVSFVTFGWLLQLLSHQPDVISSYTHIVLDEVHERDCDADLLSLLMLVLLRRPENQHIKLIVMSATLQGHLFSNYFAELNPDGLNCTHTHTHSIPIFHPCSSGKPSPSIFVGVRRFPVAEVYVDSLTEHLGDRLPRAAQMLCRRVMGEFNMGPARVVNSHKDRVSNETPGSRVVRHCHLMHSLNSIE